MESSKIFELISRALEVEIEEINIDTKSSDIPDWDSLGHLTIISEIQDAFPDLEEAEALGSASSVKEILDALGVSY